MYLGIDIGTSNVKAVVVNDDQTIVASAAAPLPISRPHALWSEQNPEDWWAAVDATVASLRQVAGVAFAAIRSIGLSGQMHGLVLLDAQGKPLRPAILHNDGRSFAEAKLLNEAVPDFGRIAGVPAMPGFAAPKVLWVRKHEPEVFAKARHLLLPKDYIRFRLTGTFATDLCDGSGAVLLDSGRRQWSPEIAAACGIGMDLLPAALEGTAISGELS
ncbi:MAG: xylulokinase, partial [Alphaproteobacteria bacterium]|nr:xylulokinase [Alphaproteobacteria bacterium]